jgi:hypothetical protein
MLSSFALDFTRTHAQVHHTSRLNADALAGNAWNDRPCRRK